MQTEQANSDLPKKQALVQFKQSKIRKRTTGIVGKHNLRWYWYFYCAFNFSTDDRHYVF